MEQKGSKHSLSTPKCTCEASCSGLSGPPSSSTCELHKPSVECELEFYEHLERLRAQEYEKNTDTHEKRMKYFRKELLEYIQETAWKYKPIEHYVRY